MTKSKAKKPGPKAEVLVVEGDWKDAMAKMLRVPAPKVATVKKKRKGAR